MVSAARETRLMVRERDTDESRCLMALLPPEIKIQIMSYISTQQSLSRLGQSCRAWYGTATEELYTRDANEHTSFAIKWMAAHAVDGQTTDSAIRALEISRRWGGQINAVKPRLSRWNESRSDDKDQVMYDTSTALHFTVFLGNMCLTKRLLDMEANLRIPCSALLFPSMGSEQLLLRIRYFLDALWKGYFGPAFPIFLAFLQSDTDMCKLLIAHGAGREAMIFEPDYDPQVMSILHFAAADPTADYHQWQCLFDKFREYIDEPCPQIDKLTPLHVALRAGCIQGMQIAVETGADIEARNSASHTPLSSGVLGIMHNTSSDPRTFDELIRCFGAFVDLGACINPDGDSVLLLAVQSYMVHPVSHPLTRALIHFLMECNEDRVGFGGWQDTIMVNEIIDGIFAHDENPESVELLKQLLSDLVDYGLELTEPPLGLPSPLYHLLHDFNSCHEWLINFLCENGATIHEDEVGLTFLHWCKSPQLWRTNKYNAWWKHRGEEDKLFLKWREDPYNVWWWQHVEQISPYEATRAYGAAFEHEDRQLYDILTHLPLPAPMDDSLVELAFESCRPWSWRLVVLREFEDDFVATCSPEGPENMIHLTVRFFIETGWYSAADAAQDIMYLRDKGVDMTSRNFYGHTPLETLLISGTFKHDVMKLVALLEGKVHKQF
ncbi:hypothetical protein E4U61_006673 [Claviceps capensis]|nr:hypothetical protein E4U61_006673 [Claviceps capensis]